MSKKTFTLLTGTLHVPENVFVAESTRTARSDFAGIINAKNSSMPIIAFFSEKPVPEFNDTDVDNVVDAVCREFPKLIEVRSAEVKPKFTTEGRLANFDEWVASPRVGLFGVPDAKDENGFCFGIGIIRGI